MRLQKTYSIALLLYLVQMFFVMSLEVSWPENYPETAPHISLDTFFNNRM